VRDLGKPSPELSEAARDWLDAVKASKIGGDAMTVKIAAEIAHLTRGTGFGELGSAIDLSRPALVGEIDAVHAVNELVRTGFIELRWRPMNRTTVEFRICQRGDLTIELPAEPAPANATARQHSENLAAAAVRGLQLSDAVSVLVEVLARSCIAAGVEIERESGRNLAGMIDKLVRARLKTLASAPQLNS
jgi:hypothetical protein